MTVSINGSGGITYPDGSTNSTRSVSTAGDTMTGALTVPNLTSTGVVRAGNSTRGALYLGGNATSNDWHFISSASEGMTIYQGQDGAGTTAFSIDLSKRVRMPGQPCFYGVAIYSTSYSGNINPIIFANGITVNNGSHYNTTGSNAGKFICPIAGRYLVVTSAHIQNNSGYTTERIYHNGVILANSWNIGCSSQTTITSIVNAGAGDSIYIGMETSQTNYISETYWTLAITLIN